MPHDHAHHHHYVHHAHTRLAGFSLLRLSAWERLGIAAVLSAAVWGVILWGMS